MNPIPKKGNVIAMGLLLMFFSCKKDNFQPAKTDNTSTETIMHDRFGITGNATINYSGTFEGVVVDAQQNPVQGVEVKSAYQSVVTDDQGKFRIYKLNSKENITYLAFTKAGYFNAFINVQNSGFNLKVLLNKCANTVTFETRYGGYISDGPASVSIPENSIFNADGSPYNGNVVASILTIHPDNSEFTSMMPGGDLRAKNSAGQDVQLYSYGMTGVELTDNNGHPLNLAPGKKARIKMSLGYHQQAAAPDEIPLWHFDENKGIWTEEGKATKKGSYYEGEVSHFSYWNFDVAGARAGVEGKITDCNNNPLPLLDVQIGQTMVQTDISGTYKAFIPSGRNDLKIIVDNPYVKNEKLSFDIPVQSSSNIYRHPDIKLTCGKILTADIIDCNDQPKVAEVSLLHNGKRLNVQISHLGKIQFQIPVNINSGLELVLASTTNSIPVATYPVAIPLNDLTNYAGKFKICKPNLTNGKFNLLDSLYKPLEKVNVEFKILTLATTTYNVRENKTTIVCNYGKYEPPYYYQASIFLNGSDVGVYNLTDIADSNYEYSNRMEIIEYAIPYHSAGGTVEILDWGYFGGKVKVKLNVLLKKLNLPGVFIMSNSNLYAGEYHLVNYQFEATRLMDIE